MTGSEVAVDKADARVVDDETGDDGAFVAEHAGHAALDGRDADVA